MEREGFAFPIKVMYEWLLDFCSHCWILEYSIVNYRWLHPEKDLNLHKDSTMKVQNKGKKVITQKEAQTKKWQARENSLGIGSSLGFEKLVVNSEITTTVAATLEQSPEHHVSPTVIVPIDTQIAQAEGCSATTHHETSKKDPVNKSNFSFHFTLDNASVEIVLTSVVLRPSIAGRRRQCRNSPYS